MFKVQFSNEIVKDGEWNFYPESFKSAEDAFENMDRSNKADIDSFWTRRVVEVIPETFKEVERPKQQSFTVSRVALEQVERALSIGERAAFYDDSTSPADHNEVYRTCLFVRNMLE